MDVPHQTGSIPRWRRMLSRLGLTLQITLLAAAVGGFVYGTMWFFRAASAPKPPVMTTAIEDVDWQSPDSSAYCLACHRDISQAMANRDVQGGHPQNVKLNDEQLENVRRMGTIAGKDNVLICRSCHTLEHDQQNRFMLAAPLDDGELCIGCHRDQQQMLGSKHDLRVSRPEERNRLGQTAAEGGVCSACHLSHKAARPAEPCVLDPEARCVTCHEMNGCNAEASVMRLDHPQTKCTGCHDPHAAGEKHFVKMSAPNLCLSCHSEMGGGLNAGMHPLGEMKYPVPKALVDAGAELGASANELTCLTCHSTHRANYEKLLTLNPASNDLCLSCHQDDLAGRIHDGVKVPGHAGSPVLSAEQQAVVRDRGGRVGPNGELLCISCHRVHGGGSQVNPDLLTFNMRFDDACSACHTGKASVVGTAHDLRTNHPQEKNLLGMTAHEGGACSACHLAHEPARKPAVTAGDPAGNCITCHQENACGKAKLAGTPDHPKTACTECHDPHQQQHGSFLVKSPETLCIECHQDMAGMGGGPHDRSRNPDKWPAETAGARGLCLACHTPHGGKEEGQYRFTTAAGDSLHDGVCLTCHKDAGWDAKGETAIIHPHNISPDQKHVPLALVPVDDQGNQRMGCRTCHDPHGGAHPSHLARVKPEEPTSALCLHCHQDKRQIELTSHSLHKLSGLGFEVDSCKPCHAMHAKPTDQWGKMLSPRFLLKDAPATQPSAQAGLPCLACHKNDGPAPLKSVITHPPISMVNVIPTTSAGYLPLFNDQGLEDPRGQVDCRTCHLSHGQPELLKLVEANPSLTAHDRHDLRMQLRPFKEPNICTECHGMEARAKFLYFHDPKRRTFNQPK